MEDGYQELLKKYKKLQDEMSNHVCRLQSDTDLSG
jgi:hypothetical protein